jgi:hypothetical protein
MAGYIGRAPLSTAVQSRTKIVSTAGQTVYSMLYQPGFLDIFLNGVKLENDTDYTATNGTQVILTAPANVGQVLEGIALSTYSLINSKINYAGTQAPSSTDDESQGYRVGGVWIDVTNSNVYRCLVDTTGAAEWIITTGISSELQDTIDEIELFALTGL